MKVPLRFLTAAVLVSIAIFVAGCGKKLVGSGTIISNSPAIEDFTKIDASHSFRVSVSSGAEFKVVVRADDNVMLLLDIRRSGETLDLGFKQGNYRTENVTLEADVTMPKLNAVDLSGASRAKLSGFSSSESFYAELSGASSVSGDLRTGDASFDLSGASSVEIVGSGQALNIDASGASGAKLSKFTGTDAIVDASGASKVSVNVSGTLNAEASGASKVTYGGNPTLGQLDSSGGASIEAE